MSKKTSTTYHHGDLRPALLDAAEALLTEEGIEGLSLRRLAERVGVSRSAPYHHFADKQALLCALAARGFVRLSDLLEAVELTPGRALKQRLEMFVSAYLRFALDEPEVYDLMFGRILWKQGHPSEELRSVAFRAFRRYAERISALASHGNLPEGARPLRLAQASWATLHGICRLLIDGIYIDRQDMEEVSAEAVLLLYHAVAGSTSVD